MKVFLCGTESSGGPFVPLKKIVSEVVPEGELEVLSRVEALGKKLLFPGGQPRIAVLAAADQTELKEFITLQEYLDNVLVVLILPDREEETITSGHRLHPRFMDFADGDFNMLGAVLKKMLKIPF